MELTVDQALQQGVAAHNEGKLQEAERLYRAILKTQPTHPDANHNLGLIAVLVALVTLGLVALHMMVRVVQLIAVLVALHIVVRVVQLIPALVALVTLVLVALHIMVRVVPAIQVQEEQEEVVLLFADEKLITLWAAVLVISCQSAH